MKFPGDIYEIITNYLDYYFALLTNVLFLPEFDENENSEH